MNNIHIIMPFSRAHLKDELLALYKDVVLHPIVFAEQNIEWDKAVAVEFSNDTNIPYYKINQFIKTQEIIDEDYYWCMCDDDSIEGGVIDKLKELTEDVIFISMKRGNSTPLNVPAVSQHPTDTLIAKPSNVKLCQIGLEQMIIKGRIFKKLKFNTKSEYADGLMAVYLKNNYSVRYEPNLFVKFNYFEPGRWARGDIKKKQRSALRKNKESVRMEDINNLICAVTVVYNTKDLFQKAYESVRKFHPNMKIIVVDGSDIKNSCYEYTQSLADDNTRVFHAGGNIGHGKGINTALGHIETKFALIFDSDIEMLKSPVNEMLGMMADDTYGIGYTVKTDLGGFNFGERPEESKKGSMRYLHPFFCLIQMKEYKKYSPFIHHGAPAVSTCLDIHKEGKSEKVIKEFPVFEYVKHGFNGTRALLLKTKNKEIEGKWNMIKTSGITCITATGDRPQAIGLCQQWMEAQTVYPAQWIIVDDGKAPMKNITSDCEYIRREPTTKDPLHTMTINLKLALSKVTGDKIIIWEDDDYYSPKYIEEMSKKLDEYDLVGIGKSKYYNIQAFRYYQHNGEAFKDHASLAQTAFKKSLIPLILKKMNGDQFLDVRIWQGLKGNAHIFDDDKESLYVGIKGMPGRNGIGSGHNPNMEGYKDDINKAVLKEWITNDQHRELYLNLKSQPNERRISVGTFKAIKNGGYIPANSPYKSSVYGRINPGTVFEYEGPVGIWMQPVEEPEREIIPIEELPIYEAAKKISEGKGMPNLDKTPLDSKLKGKRK